ncbi:MAG: phage integrase SAM-like domain-containing protein [Candidatus Marinimicrobia bacterium]|nr:phage integrase SAM-like domain-containing protein [Candidatus Neomarinimicrobiota bacterium]
MANLVRYPGGSKNKGNYNITGPYYIRIWLPNLKKVKLIPTNTENHKEAERKLKIVSEKEWLIKTEQSLLLAGLSEHRNDGKLITVVNEALGLDIITTLHKACIDYLESCNKRISQNTIDSYDIALNDLQNALSPSIRVSELSKRHFEILIDYFKKNYKSKVTINIRLRGIRAFLHWLVDAEYVEKMPFKVRLLKIEDELPKFLTPADIQAIYSQIDDPVMLSTVKVY